MKKIILSLMLLAPFFFSSCEEAKELTGAMEFTIGDESYEFPVATFVKKDGRTTITTTNVENTATISFKGITTTKYALGVGSNLEEVILNIGNLDKAENVFIFFPTGGINDSYISLYGSLIITEYTDKKIVGTFAGVGITKEDAAQVEEFEDIIKAKKKDFSGTFTAKAVN